MSAFTPPGTSGPLPGFPSLLTSQHQPQNQQPPLPQQLGASDPAHQGNMSDDAAHQKRKVARRACLSCREKKIKCDGEPLVDARGIPIDTTVVCSNCRIINRECVFVRSNRGGRRRGKDVTKTSKDSGNTNTNTNNSTNNNNNNNASTNTTTNTTTNTNITNNTALDEQTTTTTITGNIAAQDENSDESVAGSAPVAPTANNSAPDSALIPPGLSAGPHLNAPVPGSQVLPPIGHMPLLGVDAIGGTPSGPSPSMFGPLSMPMPMPVSFSTGSGNGNATTQNNSAESQPDTQAAPQSQPTGGTVLPAPGPGSSSGYGIAPPFSALKYNPTKLGTSEPSTSSYSRGLGMRFAPLQFGPSNPGPTHQHSPLANHQPLPGSLQVPPTKPASGSVSGRPSTAFHAAPSPYPHTTDAALSPGTVLQLINQDPFLQNRLYAPSLTGTLPKPSNGPAPAAGQTATDQISSDFQHSLLLMQMQMSELRQIQLSMQQKLEEFTTSMRVGGETRAAAALSAHMGPVERAESPAAQKPEVSSTSGKPESKTVEPDARKTDSELLKSFVNIPVAAREGQPKFRLGTLGALTALGAGRRRPRTIRKPNPFDVYPDVLEFYGLSRDSDEINRFVDIYYRCIQPNCFVLPNKNDFLDTICIRSDAPLAHAVLCFGHMIAAGQRRIADQEALRDMPLVDSSGGTKAVETDLPQLSSPELETEEAEKAEAVAEADTETETRPHISGGTDGDTEPSSDTIRAENGAKRAPEPSTTTRPAKTRRRNPGEAVATEIHKWLAKAQVHWNGVSDIAAVKTLIIFGIGLGLAAHFDAMLGLLSRASAIVKYFKLDNKRYFEAIYLNNINVHNNIINYSTNTSITMSEKDMDASVRTPVSSSLSSDFADGSETRTGSGTAAGSASVAESPGSELERLFPSANRRQLQDQEDLVRSLWVLWRVKVVLRILRGKPHGPLPLDLPDFFYNLAFPIDSWALMEANIRFGNRMGEKVYYDHIKVAHSVDMSARSARVHHGSYYSGVNKSKMIGSRSHRLLDGRRRLTTRRTAGNSAEGIGSAHFNHHSAGHGSAVGYTGSVGFVGHPGGVDAGGVPETRKSLFYGDSLVVVAFKACEDIMDEISSVRSELRNSTERMLSTPVIEKFEEELVWQKEKFPALFRIKRVSQRRYRRALARVAPNSGPQYVPDAVLVLDANLIAAAATVELSHILLYTEQCQGFFPFRPTVAPLTWDPNSAFEESTTWTEVSITSVLDAFRRAKDFQKLYLWKCLEATMRFMELIILPDFNFEHFEEVRAHLARARGSDARRTDSGDAEAEAEAEADEDDNYDDAEAEVEAETEADAGTARPATPAPEPARDYKCDELHPFPIVIGPTNYESASELPVETDSVRKWWLDGAVAQHKLISDDRLRRDVDKRIVDPTERLRESKKLRQRRYLWQQYPWTVTSMAGQLSTTLASFGALAVYFSEVYSVSGEVYAVGYQSWGTGPQGDQVRRQLPAWLFPEDTDIMADLKEMLLNPEELQSMISVATEFVQVFSVTYPYFEKPLRQFQALKSRLAELQARKDFKY